MVLHLARAKRTWRQWAASGNRRESGPLLLGRLRDWAGFAAGLRPWWPWSRAGPGWWESRFCGRASGPVPQCVLHRGESHRWRHGTPWNDAGLSRLGKTRTNGRLWIARPTSKLQATPGAPAPGNWPRWAAGPQKPGGPLELAPPVADLAEAQNQSHTRGWNQALRQDPQRMLSQGSVGAWRATTEKLEQAASLASWPMPEDGQKTLGSACWRVQISGDGTKPAQRCRNQQRLHRRAAQPRRIPRIRVSRGT